MSSVFFSVYVVIICTFNSNKLVNSRTCIFHFYLMQMHKVIETVLGSMRLMTVYIWKSYVKNDVHCI